MEKFTTNLLTQSEFRLVLIIVEVIDDTRLRNA